MPQPGLSAPHISSKAARTARCTGWSISTYSGAAAEAAVQREEARVLARAVVVQLAGRARPRRAAGARSGGVVGHLRAAAQVGLAEPEVGQPAPPPARRASRRPGARRRRAPAARCRGRRRRRSRPAAAPAASCRTSAAGSPPRGRPRRRRMPPAASQTTAWPRWCDSATLPRQTSTIGTASAIANPSARSSPSIACRWRKASRIRDLTVPSGRPSRAAICAVAEAVVEGGDQHRRCSGASPATAGAQPRLALGGVEPLEAVGLGVGLEQRVVRVRRPRGRRGGRRRCGGCARSRRSRSRARRAPGRSSRRGARPRPSRPARSRRRRTPRRRRASHRP